VQHHIEAVVGRYKGDIYAWDVVNEAIDETQPNCLRNDKWFQTIGSDYIDYAFRYAHDADPSARLFLNEYLTTRPAKRNCLVRVVKDMIDRGVPINGIGHQLHTSIFDPAIVHAMDETLTVFARLGLENQITELDVSLYIPHTYRLPDKPEILLAKQAELYGKLMKIFLAHADLSAVTWWGISDAHTHLNSGWSWWRSDKPLLFDSQQRAKSAYWAVLNAQ
jgi:endo-1,4-beta-xylanase